MYWNTHFPPKSYLRPHHNHLVRKIASFFATTDRSNSKLRKCNGSNSKTCQLHSWHLVEADAERPILAGSFYSLYVRAHLSCCKGKCVRVRNLTLWVFFYPDSWCSIIVCPDIHGFVFHHHSHVLKVVFFPSCRFLGLSHHFFFLFKPLVFFFYLLHPFTSLQLFSCSCALYLCLCCSSTLTLLSLLLHISSLPYVSSCCPCFCPAISHLWFIISGIH